MTVRRSYHPVRSSAAEALQPCTCVCVCMSGYPGNQLCYHAVPATAVATGESGRRWLLTLYKLLPGDGEPGEDGALPEPRLEAVPMEVPPEVPDAAGDSQDEGKDDAGDGGKQDDAPSAKEAEGEDGEEQPAVPPNVAVPNFGGTCAAGTAAVQSGSLILPKTLEPGHYVLAAADRTVSRVTSGPVAYASDG